MTHFLTNPAQKKSNVEMLQLNKHFMATQGLVAVLPVPAECVPLKLSVLPMVDAASLNVAIEVAVDSDYIQVRVYCSSGTECWIRLPERRNMSRRLEMAKNLREAAALYSLDSFVAYITDCGFVRQ